MKKGRLGSRSKLRKAEASTDNKKVVKKPRRGRQGFRRDLTNDLARRTLSGTPGKRRVFPGQNHKCPNENCDRRFKYYASLTRHLRFECQIEPPFKCGYCTFRTCYVSSVRKHWQNWHETQPLKVLGLDNGKFIELTGDQMTDWPMNERDGEGIQKMMNSKKGKKIKKE